jgi:hypothetical protein
MLAGSHIAVAPTHPIYEQIILSPLRTEVLKISTEECDQNASVPSPRILLAHFGSSKSTLVHLISPMKSAVDTVVFAIWNQYHLIILFGAGCVFFIVGQFILDRHSHRRRLPPGPKSPWHGSVNLPTQYQWKTYAAWKATYGMYHI